MLMMLSLKQPLIELFHPTNRNHFDFRPGWNVLVVTGKIDALKAQACSFGYALGRTADGPDFATETNFAGKAGAGRNGQIFKRREQSSYHGQIQCRIFDVQTPYNVQKYILRVQVKSTSFFWYCQQQLQSSQLKSAYRAQGGTIQR